MSPRASLSLRLKDVSLEIERGRFVTLMGPSGCGKSTLLHIIGAMDRPTEGEAWLEGHAVHSLGEEELTAIRRTRVGFVFQFFYLLPTLTLEENVALPLLLAHGRKVDHERVRSLIESVGLSGRRDALPTQLSGGELQRGALARAIVHAPPLVVADEPTGNLDFRQRQDHPGTASETDGHRDGRGHGDPQRCGRRVLGSNAPPERRRTGRMRGFGLLFHRYILRDLARNPIRTLLTITGVSLGIAVVVGVQLANDRAIGSFNDSLRILGGGADLQITANGLQLDEQLIGELDWVWDIGALTAIVEGRVDLDDLPNPLGRESIQIFGVDSAIGCTVPSIHDRRRGQPRSGHHT